jgi:hypothetical protein
MRRGKEREEGQGESKERWNEGEGEKKEKVRIRRYEGKKGNVRNGESNERRDEG